MHTPKLIRIRPEETRVTHSIRLSSGRIQKFERGKWYETSDPELIAICAETRSTFGNPLSTLLFDVKDRDAAMATHRDETAAKAPPPPTPEQPVVVPDPAWTAPHDTSKDDEADDVTKASSSPAEKSEPKGKSSGKR